MFAQRIKELFYSDYGTKMRRYLIVGGIAALSDWLVFALLLYVIHWHYLIAATASFILATLVNYVISLRIVFRGGRHARHMEVTYVYLASLIGLLINNCTLYVFYEWIGFHVILSKIMGTGSAFIWNFSIRYFWIFERTLHEKEAGLVKGTHIKSKSI